MEPLEHVCRAMCVSDGDNPDRVTYIVGDSEVEGRIGGGDIVNAPLGPMWQNYQRIARRILAAHDAIMLQRGTK